MAEYCVNHSPRIADTTYKITGTDQQTFYAKDAALAQPTLSVRTSAATAQLLSITALGSSVQTQPIPKEITPVTVVVRNVSDRSIAAAMIKIVIVRFDQQVETRWLLRHNVDNSSQILAPSKQYLVSPFGARAEGLLHGGVVGSFAEETLLEFAAESTHWKEVIVGVDSVLDTTDRLVGNDEASSYRMFTDWLRADRDLARSILRLREEGRSGSIIETLGLTKVDETRSTFATRDHYGRRWVQYARLFERRLRDSGLEAVFKDAERLDAMAGARQLVRRD